MYVIGRMAWLVALPHGQDAGIMNRRMGATCPCREGASGHSGRLSLRRRLASHVRVRYIPEKDSQCSSIIKSILLWSSEWPAFVQVGRS